MSGAGETRYVGWLLRVNRLLGAETALRSGRRFAHAFRTDGAPPLAPSQISRWESGQLIPTRNAIRRYERLLGLVPESLVTVADAVLRNAADPMSPLRTGGPADPEHDRDRLYHLLDRVTTGDAMTGSDWSALTELIAHRPHLELYPPTLWRDVAGLLLEESVAAAGNQWLQRQEAMSRLLRHPAARPHAITACITMASDPSSPAVIEPLALLDTTSDAAANSYILRQIERPDDERAMQAALHTAIRKISRNHFQPPESIRLLAAISDLMNDSTVDDTLLPLVVEVARRLARQPGYSDKLACRLPNASVAHQVWTAHRLTDPTTAQAVSARAAAHAQSRLPHQTDGVDTVLAALVEESLFLPDPNRSLVANWLIAATPYREPFAHVLHDEIKTGLTRRGDTYPLTTGLRTLTRIGANLHRPLIHSMLTQPGHDTTVRHAAAWATPLCSGRYTKHAWHQILATQLVAWRQNPHAGGESILQGITYGIGTDGHHELLTQIRDHPHTPSRARTMANWLLRTNPTRH